MQPISFKPPQSHYGDDLTKHGETFDEEMEKKWRPKIDDGNLHIPKNISTLEGCILCRKECDDYVEGSYDLKTATEYGIRKPILSNCFFCFTYPYHVPTDILKQIYYPVFHVGETKIVYWSVHYELGHKDCHTDMCKNPHTHILLECEPRFRKKIENKLDITMTSHNGSTITISPSIQIYNNKSQFGKRKIRFGEIQNRQRHKYNIIWTENIHELCKVETGNVLKFKIEHDNIFISPHIHRTEYVKIEQTNFRVNLINDIRSDLFDTFTDDDKIKSDLDILIIRGQDEYCIINKVEKALLKGWTGKSIIIGNYEHNGVYIVNTIGKVFARMLLRNMEVPLLRSIWLFSTTPIDELINDKDDKHCKYNIYGVNLEMNRLVQITN